MLIESTICITCIDSGNDTPLYAALGAAAAVVLGVLATVSIAMGIKAHHQNVMKGIITLHDS